MANDLESRGIDKDTVAARVRADSDDAMPAAVSVRGDVGRGRVPKARKTRGRGPQAERTGLTR
ncbi:hypothetical protein GCM10023169_20500 [Georgenia halophila]|uniref:Uncharacterized protein n=1 Tax=Georgenia halophila TaxID=620889 RepID=A0ABP8L9F1_9MICO